MKHYTLCTGIKNGQLVKNGFIYSWNIKNFTKILEVLWEEGFIYGYEKSKNLKKLRIFLKYKKGKPVIWNFKIISKPGRWVYYSSRFIRHLNSNKNFIIFSTNLGMKTITQCKKYKLGGEPLVLVS